MLQRCVGSGLACTEVEDTSTELETQFDESLGRAAAGVTTFQGAATQNYARSRLRICHSSIRTCALHWQPWGIPAALAKGFVQSVTSCGGRDPEFMPPAPAERRQGERSAEQMAHGHSCTALCSFP